MFLDELKSMVESNEGYKLVMPCILFTKQHK